MKLPYILCQPAGTEFHAMFALELVELWHASLTVEPWSSLDLDELWKAHHCESVRLAQNLARWPNAIVLELHIISRPSLDPGVSGRNEISLIVHIKDKTIEDAFELAVKNSLQISHLLQVLWPFALFRPADEATLRRLSVGPFAAHSCVTVKRRRQLLSLAHPLIPDLPVVGFRADDGKPSVASSPPAKSVVSHLFPWIPSAGETLSTLFESLLALPSARWSVIRMASLPNDEVSSQARARLESTIDTCDQFLTRADHRFLTRTAQATAIRTAAFDMYSQISGGALSGAVLLFAPGPTPDYVTANVLGQSLSSDVGRRQTSNPLEGGYAVKEVDPSAGLDPFKFYESEPFAPEEAACALRLPLVIGRPSLGLPIRRHRSVPIYRVHPPSPSGRVIRLGINRFRDTEQPVEVSDEDRLHHMVCLGSTGSGKSSLLLSMMLQDAREGKGFALIDPPGSLADNLLERFPRERRDDLVIVDLDDRERPVPLNFLAWKEPWERDLIIDTLFETLMDAYRNPDFFGPVFESNFRSGLRLLLGDRPRTDFAPTLLEFPKLFRKPEFRRWLLASIGDQDVREAIREADHVSYGDSKLENIAPYINSKLTRFLQDEQLRRIVGDGRQALDFSYVMGKNMIVLFKLAQGRLGRQVTDLWVAELVAHFRSAAMRRHVSASPSDKSFFLYCDEFGVVADTNFALMLEQIRKHRFGLVLTTQYAGQLEKKGVLQAVLANVGTLATFRLGVEDAKLLGQVFAPAVGPQDLIECPRWQGYMRVHGAGDASQPFSFQTALDSTPPDRTWASELRECSRKRWGVPAEEIEQRIYRRNKFINGLPNSAEQLRLEGIPVEEVLGGSAHDIAS